MEIEEYIDDILRMPSYLRKHVLNYIQSNGYELDGDRTTLKSQCLFLKKENYYAMVYWRDNSVVIEEKGIDLSDGSPIYGSTILRYIEIDKYNIIIEMTVDSKNERYVGSLNCDGQKIGGLFYGQQHYENVNYSDIMISRSMNSFITEMAKEVTSRTVYLITKRRLTKKEKDKQKVAKLS